MSDGDTKHSTRLKIAFYVSMCFYPSFSFFFTFRDVISVLSSAVRLSANLDSFFFFFFVCSRQPFNQQTSCHRFHRPSAFATAVGAPLLCLAGPSAIAAPRRRVWLGSPLCHPSDAQTNGAAQLQRTASFGQTRHGIASFDLRLAAAAPSLAVRLHSDPRLWPVSSLPPFADRLPLTLPRVYPIRMTEEQADQTAMRRISGL